MTENEAATPTEPSEAVYHTTEDAAQALLARWNSKSEKTTADDSESEEQASDEHDTEPAAEQADEATADAADDAPAQSDEGDGLEIDVAGDKFKFPKTLTEQAQRIQQKVKDLEAGVTRKFQEAADLRKSVEQERELTQFIGKMTAQQTDLIADLRANHRELEQLNGLNLMQLHESDPVAASRVTARLVQLQHAQRNIEARLQEATQQMRKAEADYQAQVSERGAAQLSKLIPNLTDATKAELSQYIAQRSLTPEGRQALWDPEVVAAFHDAKRYRDMMAAKPAVKKPVEPAKTLRPGTAAAPTTSARARADSLKARAFKTGATEDIAAALLARANLKR